MKYLETLAMMKKEYNFSKKGKFNYFYCFDRVFKYLPTTIADIIIDYAVAAKSDVIEPSANLKIDDKDNGLLYYIDIDYNPVNVYKNDKIFYRCLDACGVRIVAYKYNIYGIICDNDLPLISEEHGRMRKSVLVNINDINLD